MKFFYSLKCLLIAIIFLSQVFAFVACSSSNMSLRAHRYDKNSFHYKYGNSWGTHGEFWIWTEGKITYFEGVSTGPEIDTNVDIFAETEAEIFDSITQIIHNNRIDLWDGFSKSDNNVLDGHGFSLDFEYGLESVHANGYMFEPENYQAGHDALLAFLSEYAKSLQIIKPSVDSVGYMIICTDEFRFDLILSIFDGIYSRVESVRVVERTDVLSENSYKFSPENIMPADEQERYIELRFEPARQIRERGLEFALSNGWPSEDISNYIIIHYQGTKITGNHFCYAALSQEENDWFTKKIRSVVGLSEDFDFNTLFNSVTDTP